MNLKCDEVVTVTRGQYKGMTGRVAELQIKGKGRGPHAVIFLEGTLRRITVAVRYLIRAS